MYKTQIKLDVITSKPFDKEILIGIANAIDEGQFEIETKYEEVERSTTQPIRGVRKLYTYFAGDCPVATPNNAANALLDIAFKYEIEGQKIDCGYVTVDTKNDTHNPEIRAELLAIMYLLTDYKLPGMGMTADSNLDLLVSSNEIIELFEKKSNHKNLIAYASFLYTRFCTANIIYEQAPNWPSQVKQQRHLIEGRVRLDRVPVNGYGFVQITQHAMTQIKERQGLATADEAWKYLTNLLRTGNWKEIPVKENFKRKDSRNKNHQNIDLYDKESGYQICLSQNPLYSNKKINTIFHPVRKIAV